MQSLIMASITSFLFMATSVAPDIYAEFGWEGLWIGRGVFLIMWAALAFVLSPVFWVLLKAFRLL